FSTRALMRHMLDRLDKQGLAWRAGLEVEFHLLKLTDAAISQDHIAMPGPSPKVALLNHGYQYLTEQRYDAIEPLMEMLRGNLQALGLPLRSLEIEFGPSQVEVTFGAVTGIQSADNMLLFRNAAKQVFARAGYLASFMCRPQLPHIASSGWHLHHSIEDADGHNLFPRASRSISTRTGIRAESGLLATAPRSMTSAPASSRVSACEMAACWS